MDADLENRRRFALAVFQAGHPSVIKIDLFLHQLGKHTVKCLTKSNSFVVYLIRCPKKND